MRTEDAILHLSNERQQKFDTAQKGVETRARKAAGAPSDSSKLLKDEIKQTKQSSLFDSSLGPALEKSFKPQAA